MTQLQDGQLSIIVDPGAWSNLIGTKRAKALILQIEAHELFLEYKRPQQHKLGRALEVAGVGKGSRQCEYELEFN